ncbi:hypothetical protein [Sinisalibacter aestuarii]|uniref:PH domain-containing protein n=1 Tax=Sinisalibacter aestuarii TaxID=2949426 RepID=A0ABQ5LMQ2_9RHOB|nr:hypothetical protein [Sinisalibacter aestuarii]GKY86300.1 hypothetical protein STA1M1_01690 [Sinisalibacter aestuarii]
MSARPDIAAQLAPGEALLWSGHPRPGRRVPLKATAFAAALFTATLLLAVLSWYVAIFRGHLPGSRPLVLGILTLAALFTYAGLRLTVLDRRRARARDGRTAYGITPRRALALTGPYLTELALRPGVAVSLRGGTVIVSDEDATLRFERLDDGAAARDILIRQIEGGA